MRVCKFCKSEIPEDAIKCKSCGEFLEEKYRKSSSRLYRGLFQFSPKIYCTNCGYEGKTSSLERKGSGFTTLLLLFLAIIPGLIYENRRGKHYYVCPKCKSEHINKIN